LYMTMSTTSQFSGGRMAYLVISVVQQALHLEDGGQTSSNIL
jgi:hypothetical protein